MSIVRPPAVNALFAGHSLPRTAKALDQIRGHITRLEEVAKFMNNPSGEVQNMIRHARINNALHSVVTVAREIADYGGGADCPCSDEYVMGALRERLAMLDELMSTQPKPAPGTVPELCTECGVNIADDECQCGEAKP